MLAPGSGPLLRGMPSYTSCDSWARANFSACLLLDLLSSERFSCWADHKEWRGASDESVTASLPVIHSG